MDLGEGCGVLEALEYLGNEGYACEDSVGYALYKFLHEVDVISSKIGVLNKYEREEDLRVSGLMVSNSDCCDLLSDLEVPLDCTPKFGKAFNSSAMALLNMHIKKYKCRDGELVKARLKGIESNKMLIAPVKPGTVVEVCAEDKKHVIPVHTVKWINSKDTRRLEYIIITDKITDLNNKRRTINIEKYGEEVTMCDLERVGRIAKGSRKLIKMSRFGIIDTIVTGDSSNTLVIDNQYMYCIEKDRARIIGYWNGRKMQMIDFKDRICQTSAFKELDKHMDYIVRHRRYISPYGLCGYNLIKLGGSE